MKRTLEEEVAEYARYEGVVGRDAEILEAYHRLHAGFVEAGLATGGREALYLVDAAVALVRFPDDYGSDPVKTMVLLAKHRTFRMRTSYPHVRTEAEACELERQEDEILEAQGRPPAWRPSPEELALFHEKVAVLLRDTNK